MLTHDCCKVVHLIMLIKVRRMIIVPLLCVNLVSGMDPTTQDLVTPLKDIGEACGYESCPEVVKDMLNVHIVPHSHAELSYTKNFYQEYTGEHETLPTTNINVKRILDFTISELWARTERTFVWSDMPYFFHWWANRDETVRRMVYQLVRQGRLQFVGGGWSMTSEPTASYHAIIDQFTYSLRKINATFLQCGRPLVSWQADSFGHTREFASLTARMGYDGLFINPISFEDELRRMREKELEMLWRGSDDLGAETDIFTHKLFDGYWSPPGFCFGSLCNDPLLFTSNSHSRNIDERVDVFIESMRERQAPHYGSRHVMVVMGKRFGYYDASMWFENIDKLIIAVNSKSAETKANLRMYYSSPACYLKAVHAANPVFPTKQDDFVPVAYNRNTYFSGLFSSRPTVKYMAREGHVFLQMAKQLQVLARLKPNSAIFEEFNWVMGEFAMSLRGFGVFQDHLILSGTMLDSVKEYYTHKMYIAVQKSTIILQQAFNKLRNSPPKLTYFRCSFNISSCIATDGLRYFIVIYNPLAWPVSVPVRLPVSMSKFTVYDPNFQKVKTVVMKIPSAVLKIPNRYKSITHELVFIAESVPPIGYRSYFIERTINKQKRSIIKKINKNKSKKYLIRQANMKIDDETFLASVDPNYDYDDDPVKSKIEFGNVTGNDYVDDSEILTPKPRTTETVMLQSVEEEVTMKYEGDDSTTTTETIETSTVEIEENNFYVSSNDMFISNKYINISLDSSQQVTDITLSNQVKMKLKIKMFYYASDDPESMFRTEDKRPGSSVFRPMDTKTEEIRDKIKVDVLKSDVVEELHTKLADYASFTVKLYAEQPVVEIDWVIGPIPVDDGIGKDVFVRYETDLNNNGVFYTDSNGRQTIKRITNEKVGYEAVNKHSIEGNIYPVTSKIHIEDFHKNIRFSVFNDRSQGGTSLKEGQIDLMIHRRLLTRDSGLRLVLNETEYDRGHGIRVRGKHFLYISKADHKPNKIFEKKFAKEIELAPQVFISRNDRRYTKDVWLASNNTYSGLKKKLPIGIHLLTIEEWNEGTILIRLENYLEKADTIKDGVKNVFLKDLFENIIVKDVKETTLAGNIWFKDWVPLQWQTKEEFYENFNEFYGGNNTTHSKDTLRAFFEVDFKAGIKLTPQEIRTFVVWFEYVGI